LRPRDVRVHLHDVVTAAAAIRSFTDGRSLSDYRDDLMLRSAVERQFEILGEALMRAMRAEPDLADSIPAVKGAIDFRNVIAHEYDALSPATVWDIARNELPALASEVSSELGRRDSAGGPASSEGRPTSP
jgi:uncharacterized protein with HEPN domain